MPIVPELLSSKQNHGDYDKRPCSSFFRLLPFELRSIIFDLVLTERLSGSKEWPVWQAGSDIGKSAWWVRPDYTGRKVIFIDLLLVCKQAYFEAQHFVLLNKSHIFWHGYNSGPPNLAYAAEESYFERFTSTQWSSIKKIRLNLRSNLLATELHRVCRLESLRCIKKIQLTIRRADWPRWEVNGRLISSLYGTHFLDAVGQQVNISPRIAPSSRIEMSETTWGSALKHLQSLEELELELEVPEERIDELNEVVRIAQDWRFSVGIGSALVHRPGHGDELAEISTWQGPYCNWNNVCSVCGRWRWASHAPVSQLSPSSKPCHNSLDMSKPLFGPKLTVIKLRFVRSSISFSEKE